MLFIFSGNILNIMRICNAGQSERMIHMTVTKDTLIGEILDVDMTTAEYFLEMGMHCLGCPASRGETLEQACVVHGVDVNELLDKINAHINA